MHNSKSLIRIDLLFFVVLATLTLHGCVSETEIKPEDRTTYSYLEAYGVKLALPNRWNGYPRGETHDWGGTFEWVMSANDTRGMQQISVYRKQADAQLPLAAWIQDGITPNFMQAYSEGYGYTLGRARDETAKTETGEKVSVRYQDVSINGNNREVTFISFTHRNQYVVIVVANRGTYKSNVWVVEEAILKGLRLDG